MNNIKEYAPQELKGKRFDPQILALKQVGAGGGPVVEVAANGGETNAELRLDANGDALLVEAAVEAYTAAGAVVTRTNLGLVTVTVEDNSGSGKQVVPAAIPLQLFAGTGPGEDPRPFVVPFHVKANGVLAFKIRNDSAVTLRIRASFTVLRFTNAGSFTL